MVTHRASKSPLIFGAKSDLEMREWMMAIKLLAEKLSSQPSASTTPVTAPAGGLVMAASGGVARRRMSQQSQQYLLHAPRRDDITRRSSPQLQTSINCRWSTGKLHVHSALVTA